MNVSIIILLNIHFIMELIWKLLMLHAVLILMHILIAEGVTSDDIFGIHTELKLPSSKIQSHLAIGDEDNTELESVSGKSKMYFKGTIALL